jgi:hypothetical protein
MVGITEEQRKGREAHDRLLLEVVRQSRGETKTFVVDHQLKGITPDMLDWAWDHMDTEYYRLWSPDHIAWEWELHPDEAGRLGAIHIAWEKVAGETVGLRIRWDDPASSPIPITLFHALLMSVLASDDTILMQIIGEWDSAPQGVHLRTTFLLPAAAPDEFLEAHRLHCIEEVQGMGKALPQFCQRTGWQSSSGQKRSDE